MAYAPHWKAAYPQQRRDVITPYYYTSKRYRFVRDTLDLLKTVGHPIEYLIEAGTAIGVMVPDALSWSTRTVAALTYVGLPFQTTALLVDVLALERLLEGKCDEKGIPLSKLTCLGLSLLIGGLRILEGICTLGFFVLTKLTLWRFNFISSICTFISSLLRFSDEYDVHSSKITQMNTGLSLLCATLAFFLFFQASLPLQIIYLTASTLTLILNGLEIEKII